MFIRSALYTAPASEPITLAEAKAHIRVEHNVDDALIGSYIASARDMAESYLNRRLIEQTWEYFYSDFDSIRLKGIGTVVSVASVMYLDESNAWQTLSDTQYDVVKSLPPEIKLRTGAQVPRLGDLTERVKVRVTTRETPIAAGIKTWMLLQVGNLYENREAEQSGNGSYELKFVDGLLGQHRIVDFA